MAREYQNGDGFGYILVFRKKDTSLWSEVQIPHVESSRYVYFNESLLPHTPFEVKIKAYNRRGEGPFSQLSNVYSAEEGELFSSFQFFLLYQLIDEISNLCSYHHVVYYQGENIIVIYHDKNINKQS